MKSELQIRLLEPADVPALLTIIADSRAEYGIAGHDVELLEPADESESFGVITIWSTRAAAEAYEASGTAGEVVSLVKEFFAGPPTLRSYESASDAGLFGMP